MKKIFVNSEGAQIEAPQGFSWTVLLFGFFPPLFRGDILWAAIIFAAAIATSGLSSIVIAFFYNDIYEKSLAKKGFTVKK